MIDPELVHQSIAVLRAYLEQTAAGLEHRPAEARLTGPAAQGGGNGRLRMSRAEALDVLGLAPTASAQEYPATPTAALGSSPIRNSAARPT